MNAANEKPTATTGTERLGEYRRKRRFDRTKEPPGGPAEAAGHHRFVVQEHHATRLHWDLRLEHRGTLASWALPRGFPDRPEQNRLAIHTEDHPLEYLAFSGDIPRGEYGAGAMTIWDSGTYTAEKFNDREVIVDLHGDRVSGYFALFQTGGDQWLIHRMDPPEEDPMPPAVEPMSAVPSELPADDSAWAFEIEWSGIRALAHNTAGHLRLLDRAGVDITADFPEVRPLMAELGARRVILDGMLVAFDASGMSNPDRLARRTGAGSATEAKRRAGEDPATYVIFDLLFRDGDLLLERPYVERRRALEELELRGQAWQVPGWRHGDGAEFLAAARRQGLPGVIAKRLDSGYRPGQRSGDWLRIQTVPSQDVVIGGWLPARGRRDGIDALLVGYHAGDGHSRDLRYAGRVPVEPDTADAAGLLGRLTALRARRSPFRGRRPPASTIFTRPELVCSVQHDGWTAAGTLRDPSYLGVREGRAPDQVVREDRAADHIVREDRPRRAAEPSPPSRSGRTGSRTVRVEGREIALTNLDKVLYPRSGTTKSDVIDFYRAVAPALLPHVRGRPLTMKRYPDGVERPPFFEKRVPPWRPDWLHTAAVWSRSNGHDIEYCLLDDLPSLVWAANLANLELHTMLGTATHPDRPSMVVFDLDPGPRAGLLECARVAGWVREVLESLDLTVLVKGSGSKGLHIHVPLNSDTSYDQTKPLARAVAQLVEKDHPRQVISRMTRSARTGKVFIDWSQNSAHKTTVTPFSLRAVDPPAVAAPLRWDEVERVAAGEAEPEILRFGPARLIAELEERSKLFAPVVRLRQKLPSFG